MQLAIKSVNDIYFIGTANLNNAFCHLNAVIQFLHGSKILNQYLLKNFVIRDDQVGLNSNQMMSSNLGIQDHANDDMNDHIKVERISEIVMQKYEECCSNLNYEESEFKPNDARIQEMLNRDANDVVSYVSILLRPLIYYAYVTDMEDSMTEGLTQSINISMRSTSDETMHESKSYSQSSDAILYENDVSPSVFERMVQFSTTYQQLMNEVCNMVNDGYSGYFPMIDLMLIMLPAIFMIMDSDTFISIVRELNISVINFDPNEIAYNCYFNESSFFDQSYTKIEYALWKFMMLFSLKNQELLPVHPNSNFVVGIVDVFPDRTKKNGHAINILKCKDECFYIIDDDRKITRFDEWIAERMGTVYEICIRNIGPEVQDEINEMLKNSKVSEALKLEPRVSQRYVITIQCTQIGGANGLNESEDCESKDDQVCGNEVREFMNDCDKGTKTLIWSCVVFLILVLVIVIACVVAKNRSNVWRNGCQNSSWVRSCSKVLGPLQK